MSLDQQVSVQLEASEWGTKSLQLNNCSVFIGNLMLLYFELPLLQSEAVQRKTSRTMVGSQQSESIPAIQRSHG